MEETRDNELPICGRDSRLKWLRIELEKQAGYPGASYIQPIELIGWYLRYGFSLGFSMDELLHALQGDDEWLILAENASAQDLAEGKPPPRFSIGDFVEVIVNARNVAYRQGTISDMLWHDKHGVWHYFIEENGKRIGKRYEARDLRQIPAPE